MDYKKIAAAAKTDSFQLASLTSGIRNQALQAMASALTDREALILDANEKDLKKAKEDGLPGPILARLKYDDEKLQDCVKGMNDLINLPDPLFSELLRRQLDDDLTLVKTTCPIGVIGVIFESRPDALVQISALCVKSGNCAILKGGSEASATNRVLFDLLHEAGVSAGLPSGFLTLVEDRAGIDTLLKCHESIDLIVPRGSNQFVQYIMENSKIPVMGHADGVCHVYVDKEANITKAIPVILDSKTQYVAACNAVETLLVHRGIAPQLLKSLGEVSSGSNSTAARENSEAPENRKAGSSSDALIELRGDEEVARLLDCIPASPEDFETEYLDYILSIKLVDSVEEAVGHINRYGSHHTDCILTEDPKAAALFMANVDSAGVYQNCSTRFADGFRYGFGAEVGISTGKLHARGPVGLDGLVTYKYQLFGNGQIVADYASGARSFEFLDL